jgi:hypothetical protein
MEVGATLELDEIFILYVLILLGRRILALLFG